MAEKLGPGDNFPDMTLSLDSGGGINLPSDFKTTMPSSCSIAAIGDPTAAGSWPAWKKIYKP